MDDLNNIGPFWYIVHSEATITSGKKKENK
jgi:hypothetical protein